MNTNASGFRRITATTICALFLVGWFTSAACQAAPLVVNPLTGLDAVEIDQRFYWGGEELPVFISSIGGPGGGLPEFDPTYELTVGTLSTVDAVALDGFVPGDVFELWADDSPVAWDNSFFDDSGYFHGELDEYLLTTGTHQFTIRVTDGLTSGGAWLSFSPVTEVPEPSTIVLLSVGLVVLIELRRRRRTG